MREEKKERGGEEAQRTIGNELHRLLNPSVLAGHRSTNYKTITRKPEIKYQKKSKVPLRVGLTLWTALETIWKRMKKSC